MKKSLIILGLLSILTTTTFSATFLSFLYAKDKNKERTLLDDNGNLINFQNTEYYKIKLGTEYFPSDEKENPLGWYVDLGGGRSDKTSYIYNNQNKEFERNSFLLNIGTTYAPINNSLVCFGGIGIEHIKGYSQEYDIDFIQIENKFNVNGGIAMYFFEGALGVIAEYDTAREAIGVGLTLRYQSSGANRYVDK